MGNTDNDLANQVLTDPGLGNLGKLVNHVAVGLITIVVAAMGLLGSNYQNSQAITANAENIRDNLEQLRQSQKQINDTNAILQALLAQTQAFQQNSRERTLRLERQVDGVN